MKEDVAIETAEAGGANSKKAPYWDPPPAPLLDTSELKKWSLYRALIAEFMATLIFLYVSIATVIGYKTQSKAEACTGVGFLGVAWSFGATIFILVYCTGGVSGGHINPAVTFGLFVGRKLSLVRTVLYIAAQCLGAICGVGIVKGIMKQPYDTLDRRRRQRGVHGLLRRERPRRRGRRHVHPRVHRLLRHRPQAHRHGHQPGQEPRRRRPLQPARCMERPLDLLGWDAHRGDGGGVVPQARAARGGRQGARLLQEHRRHGVSCESKEHMRASASCTCIYMKRRSSVDFA